MAQEEEVLGKAYDSRLMRRLLTYLRPYRWQVAVALNNLIGRLQSLSQSERELRHQQAKGDEGRTDQQQAKGGERRTDQQRVVKSDTNKVPRARAY